MVQRVSILKHAILDKPTLIEEWWDEMEDTNPRSWRDILVGIQRLDENSNIAYVGNRALRRVRKVIETQLGATPKDNIYIWYGFVDKNADLAYFNHHPNTSKRIYSEIIRPLYIFPLKLQPHGQCIFASIQEPARLFSKSTTITYTRTGKVNTWTERVEPHNSDNISEGEVVIKSGL